MQESFRSIKIPAMISACTRRFRGVGVAHSGACNTRPDVCGCFQSGPPEIRHADMDEPSM